MKVLLYNSKGNNIMKKCPICNHDTKRTTNGTLQTKHKTSNGCKDILVENLSYSQCDYCNEIFYNPDDLDNYEIQLERALEKERRSENLLTAKEIKAIRKKYSLTQLQLELLLKIGPKNVAKWETYKSNQSPTIDKLLRNMNDDYCFFLKMLSRVEIRDFQNIINEHSFYLENISILELISKFYPDVNIRTISKDFIEHVNKVVENILESEIEQSNSQLRLKEAV